MSPRQRGAVWFLALFLVGRGLEFFPLPFVARHAKVPEAPAGDAAPDRRDTTVTVVAPPPAPPPATSAAADTNAAIAINHASVEELQRLPRVGPVLAARIVAERQAGGPFRSAADLQRVPGIGPRTAARLAPLLRFD